MSEDALRRHLDDFLDQVVGSGSEVGVQVAVLRCGRIVVDAARGVADPRSGVRVTGDTLFWAGSTAKGVATSLAHVLIDRGVLDDEMRVVEVWPEFGSHGKDAVTLRHVLMHTAGIPGLPPDTTASDLCDWEYMCAVLADSEPWWAPGTRFGYHAKTFGFLLGETVRRATGRTVSAVLRELITRPLGVEDEVHFGVPDHLLPRVARQVPGEAHAGNRPEPGSALHRAMPPGVAPDAGYANRADVLAADIPSEGTMTARGAALIYAALLGHVEGITLVTSERRSAMAAVAFRGMDEVMGFPTAWAYGYSPTRPSGVGRPGSCFGMVGMNGSAAYADIDSGVAVAVMRNRFTTADLATATEIDRIVAEDLP